MTQEKETQLLDGETIIWKGHPHGLPVTIDHLNHLFFLFLTCTFIYGVGRIAIPLIVPMLNDNPLYIQYLTFGAVLLFSLIVLIMGCIRFQRSKNTFYFVTNLRAMIYQQYHREIFISVDFCPSFSMSLQPGSNGFGNIYFNTTSRMDMLTQLENQSDNARNTGSLKFRFTAKPFSACFLRLDNADEVFNIIKKASGYQDLNSTFEESFD